MTYLTIVRMEDPMPAAPARPNLYRAAGTHMEEWSVVGSAATLIREVAMPVTARPGSLQTITYDSDRALVWASDSGAAAAEGLVALNATTFAHTGLFPLPADNGGSFLTSDIASHSGDGWIWVVSVDEEACALDPENNASVAVSFSLPTPTCWGITRGAGTDLWVGDVGSSPAVYQIAADSGTVQATHGLSGDPDPYFLSYDSSADELWIAQPFDDVLYVYDAATMTELRSVDVSATSRSTTGITLL